MAKIAKMGWCANEQMVRSTRLLDLIVERTDGRVVAIEVKLGRSSARRKPGTFDGCAIRSGKISGCGGDQHPHCSGGITRPLARHDFGYGALAGEQGGAVQPDHGHG